MGAVRSSALAVVVNSLTAETKEVIISMVCNIVDDSIIPVFDTDQYS